MKDGIIIRLKTANPGIGWDEIATHLDGRDRRQCRERWTNYLDPSETRAPITKAEDDLLRRRYDDLGPKWALVRGDFPGRTDVFLKNHFRRLQKRSHPRRVPTITDQSISRDQRHITDERGPIDDFQDLPPCAPGDDDDPCEWNEYFQ
jgi:hypothetical protein